MRPRPVLLIVALVLLVSTTTPGRADVQRFPYSARVIASGEYARSGPGRKYYPTAKLTTGATVTVHRHDPGGWYMIAPPEGSFSWIAAEHVKRSGTTGLVQAEGVPVRVGSTFDDVRDVEQRRLSPGDPVTILGEKTFPTENGPRAFLKIEPPEYEYRWIPGSAVMPVDAELKQQRQADPFAPPIVTDDGTKPEGTTEPEPASVPEFGTDAQPMPTPEATPAPFPQPNDSGTEPAFPPQPTRLPEPSPVPTRPVSNPSAEPSARGQIIRTMTALDAEFAEALDGPIATWNLDPIEQGYLSLFKASPDMTLKSKLRTRLDAVSQSISQKREYDSLMALIRKTDERDAAIRAEGERKKQAIQQGPSLSGPKTTPRPNGPGSSSILNGPNTPSRTPSASPTPRDRNTQPIPTTPSTETPGGSRSILPASGTRTATEAGSSPQVSSPPSMGSPSRTAPRPLGTPPRTANNSTPQKRTTPKFSGAGIVQRAATPLRNGANHVLLAPDGRVLAYLIAGPGVALDQHRGRSMGVVGPRMFRNDLQADLITVRQLTPVRLRLNPASSPQRQP